MIAALCLLLVVASGVAGAKFGLHIGTERTDKALALARYRDAIALAEDLVKTPDALDLRPRAQKILAAHHAAGPAKGY